MVVELRRRRDRSGSVHGLRGGSSRLLEGTKLSSSRIMRQALGVVVRQEVRHAGLLVVRHGAAELFLGDLFVRDGLDDVGAGDEHVRGLVDHQDEVGDGRRVDRAAGARSHDGGDLRDHARGQRVAQEDVGVAGERHHAFLDARAAGVVQADDGRADLHGHVHDLDDLGGVGLGERSAEDGEVLREDEDQPAVDAAVAGDEAVAVNTSARPCRSRCSDA